MARKTATQKTHLKSKHKVAKARRGDDPPLCWWWKEKDRVLFVDKTRDNRFAVYYVPDKYLSDRGQRKTRFTALTPQELRGYMQMKLDEFAKSQEHEKCPKRVYDSIQQALKIGEQQ